MPRLLARNALMSKPAAVTAALTPADKRVASELSDFRYWFYVDYMTLSFPEIAYDMTKIMKKLLTLIFRMER